MQEPLLLDAAWDGLRPAPDPPGSSALATVVSGLLEGTGLTLRMDSLGVVMGWIGGADASAQITARLTAAVGGSSCRSPRSTAGASGA